MKFNEWLKEHDEFSCVGPSMEPQIAVDFLREYLLGKDFCIPYRASTEQVNSLIVLEILMKYSKRFRKELREEEG